MDHFVLLPTFLGSQKKSEKTKHSNDRLKLEYETSFLLDVQSFSRLSSTSCGPLGFTSILSNTKTTFKVPYACKYTWYAVVGTNPIQTFKCCFFVFCCFLLCYIFFSVSIHVNNMLFCYFVVLCFLLYCVFAVPSYHQIFRLLDLDHTRTHTCTYVTQLLVDLDHRGRYQVWDGHQIYDLGHYIHEVSSLNLAKSAANLSLAITLFLITFFFYLHLVLITRYEVKKVCKLSSLKYSSVC